MSLEIVEQHKKDCIGTLFIKLLEELKKHEHIPYLAFSLQQDCYLRSLCLFCTN